MSVEKDADNTPKGIAANKISLKVLYTHPLETILCILLLTATILAFTQVVFRYIIHYSLSWSEELARFIFMWITMLGAAYGFKTKSHFALLFVVNRLGVVQKKYASLVVMLISSAFIIIFIVKSVQFIFLATIDQVAPGTQISMAIPYSSAPVGGVLILYYIIRNFIEEYRKPSRVLKQD